MSSKTISIVKETRFQETRIVLLPHDLGMFIDSGYEIFVETNAGAQIGYFDEEYVNAGASIVSREEAWGYSNYIPKLLCITENELQYLRKDMHLSAFFYAGENYHLIQKMCSSEINAYSYEYFEDDCGRFPMMVADGWISGRLALLNAAFYLQSTFGGSGIVLGGMHQSQQSKVVVIGHGNVGKSAARTALSLGAEVTVAGRSHESLKRFANQHPAMDCVLVSDQEFKQVVLEADIVVGAILISTYDTPAMLTEYMVRKMKRGSVIVDVTCGYGKGYMPTADKITMPGVGPYERHGVLHLKNPRFPAMAPLSAVQNASQLYAPYLLALGEMIFDEAKQDIVSRNGQILKKGAVVHPHVLSDFSKIESRDYENYELSDHLIDVA